MARMHSDGRGSSGSTKPVTDKVPDWVDYSEEEVENLVVKLAKDDIPPSQIGLKLRDQYGIPSVKAITGKKITEILEENDLDSEIPEDLSNLLDKAEDIREHLDENPQDGKAERRLELTKEKIRRLADYHREAGNIPETWEYSEDN